MSKELLVVYRYDEDGWFTNPTFAQWSEYFKEYSMPDRTTKVAPEAKDGYWYKYDDQSDSWNEVKIPTTPEEVMAMGAISHQSQTDHSIEARLVLQLIAEKYQSTHRIVRGEEDLSWSLEAIPEKTPEEKAIEAAEQKRATAQANLSKTDYVAVKIAEGVATKEEYAKVLAQRQVWRDEVNSAEAELMSLRGE